MELAISHASSMLRTLISAPLSCSEVLMVAWRGIVGSSLAMLSSTLAM